MDGMLRDAGASAQQEKPWEHMDVRPFEAGTTGPGSAAEM